jgi:NADH-ubiquinone oxidoreductase chain 3
MTTTTFFIIFIPILSILLLSVNLLLAPHNPYQEKDSVFECGFHSFLGQNRTQFNISFFIFGLLFLLFDLEILLVYPYSVSSYTNDIYGLIIMMLFFVLLTLGFIFELGKNALTIDSKQTSISNSKNTPYIFAFTGTLLQSVIPFNSIFSIASLRVAQKKMGSSTQRRSYSTGLPRIYPIKVYDNADVDKSLIFSKNTNKSGIYRWVNTNNNQSYVGSSVDLRVRLLKSHPLLRLANSYLVDSPQPINLSYLWNFGSLLAFCLVIQRITGVTLAMHYNPSVTEAFNSVYSLDANFIMCDAPRAWGLYFQDSASPQMEALVKLYGDIMFYLEAIGFTATSIIGTIEPGIDIDLGNQVSLYAAIFLLLLVSELFRRIHKPKLHIQCEVVMVKDGDTSKLCLIDLNDQCGHNLWLYYHLSSDVTRHSVRWNGKTWHAVMSKTFPPAMSPNGLSPIVHDYLYSRFVNNDSIDLYAPILEVVFPGPNMVQYGLLCQDYDVKTFNGLHNHRTEFLPMDLILGTVDTGYTILPLKLYKWTMQIEQGNVLSNC